MGVLRRYLVLLLWELIASRIDYITRRVQNKYFEIAGDPTVYVLGDKEQGLFKNISNNEKRLWVNDGGTMFKSAALT